MTARKTFLNLDEETRRRIIDTAFLEFTMNDYKNASLSAIIKNLGLAKGSFYRYFSSKKDLYLYLVEYATNTRYDEIDKLTEQLPEKFENLLKINFLNKIKYDRNFPLYSGFTYRVMLELNNDELQNISQSVKQKVLERTKKILLLYQSKNKIRDDIDLDAIAFTIWQTQLGIYEYLSIKHNVNFIQNIAMGKPVFTLGEEEIMKVVNDFITIITKGITKN